MIIVTDHGILADGKTLNTSALQALIDETAAQGGGTLCFPAGTYLTGGLELRSNLHLHFEMAATLLGSTTLEDYPLYDPPPVRFPEDAEGLRSLLFAHECENVHLSGPGSIDGQGPEFKRYTDVRAGLPRVIWFADCQDICVDTLTLRHSGFWMQHYLKCTGVVLQGLDIYNHGSTNNDGCDIDCCRDVIIQDCRIDSHDDAICLKSGNHWPTENVVISNCITRTHCNHFKTGTESNGGFRNITVTNIQMVPSKVIKSDEKTGGADYRGACGIALGCVDGGMLENIQISHVQMDETRVPFFIKLGDRAIPISGSDIKQPPQFGRNIHLSHLSARNASVCGGYIMGLPELPLEDISIKDCVFDYEGGGTEADANRTVDLGREVYPSCDAFGSLPAFGIFIRDVKGIKLENLQFSTTQPDARPALRWQQVRNLTLNHISQING